MLLQNLRAKMSARLSGDREAGFTLIELLVVMLILGILAAIALPAFFNQKDKAGDAKAKEYVHSAQVAMETCFTDRTTGTYVGCIDTALETIEPSLTNAPDLTVSNLGTNTYRIQVRGSGSQQFWIANAAGVLTFQCTAAGTGGCPGSGGGTGTWG